MTSSLNRLQRLRTPVEWCVSLTRDDEVDPALRVMRTDRRLALELGEGGPRRAGLGRLVVVAQAGRHSGMFPCLRRGRSTRLGRAA